MYSNCGNSHNMRRHMSCICDRGWAWMCRPCQCLQLWRCWALTCLSHLKWFSKFSQLTQCWQLCWMCIVTKCDVAACHVCHNVMSMLWTLIVGIVRSVTIAIVGWRMYCLQLCLAYQDCAATRASRRTCCIHSRKTCFTAWFASTLLIQCSQLAAIWHKLQLALLCVENFRHGTSLWHEDVG